MAFRDATEDPSLLTPAQRRAVELENERAEAATPPPADAAPAADPTPVEPPATETAAPEQPAPEPRQRRKSLRDQLLEQMGRERLSVVHQEIAENEKLATVGDDTPAEPAPVAQPVAQPTPAPAAPLADIETIKVDGQEYQITRAQMLQQMPQLGDVDPKLWVPSFNVFAAAQKRLFELNRLRAAAQQAQAQAQAQPATTAPAAPAPEQPDPKAARREKLLEAARALQFGDIEQAADALDRIATEQSVDETQIRRIAAETAARQSAQMQFEAARTAEVTQAIQKHADIMNDPVLGAGALVIANNLLADDLKVSGIDPTKVDAMTPHQQGVVHAQLRMHGRGKSMEQIFDEATSRVRSHPRLAPTFTRQTAEPPSLAEKRAMKMQTVPTPVPSSTRAVIPKPQDSAAPDVSAIVARMRKARGHSALQ